MLEAKAKNTKKSETKAKDSSSENIPSQGQGLRRKCSPKKGLQIFFSGSFQKKTFSKKFFLAMCKILTIQKILMLSSSQRQGNFRGNEASRLRPRT